MTKISKNNINKLAENVKKYVEANQKIPSTVTIDNVKYTWSQIWYILSWAVNNLNKDLDNVPNVKASSNPTGDNINEKIYPNDYKDQSKRIVQFIKQNGQTPNFVTSVKSKKKIRPRLSVYANARIIVWYYNKRVLPSYCTYDSSKFKSSKKSSPSAKYGHATKQGCDNMGQNTPYFCGPHSVQEVIRNLYNIVIPQKSIASVMGTTTSGTDHQGFHTFVAWFNKKYNKKLSISEKYFSDVGVEGLNKIIKSKNQDFIVHLAYQLKYGHYETVNRISGSTWNIQNSLGSKCSQGCYCGHKQSRDYSTEKAWINAKSGVKSILIFTKG